MTARRDARGKSAAKTATSITIGGRLLEVPAEILDCWAPVWWGGLGAIRDWAKAHGLTLNSPRLRPTPVDADGRPVLNERPGHPHNIWQDAASHYCRPGEIGALREAAGWNREHVAITDRLRQERTK